MFMYGIELPENEYKVGINISKDIIKTLDYPFIPRYDNGNKNPDNDKIIRIILKSVCRIWEYLNTYGYCKQQVELSQFTNKEISPEYETVLNPDQFITYMKTEFRKQVAGYCFNSYHKFKSVKFVSTQCISENDLQDIKDSSNINISDYLNEFYEYRAGITEGFNFTILLEFDKFWMVCICSAGDKVSAVERGDIIDNPETLKCNQIYISFETIHLVY